jgi:hypothetical protein
MSDLQQTSSPWAARLVNIFSGLYLFLVGIALALVLLVAGAPSFWFLPASILLALSGILWFRPRMAASFSLLFTLVFFFLLLSLKPWTWTDARVKGFGVLLVLLVAVGLCAAQIRVRGIDWKALVTSAICILIAFGVDRTFTNRVHLRTLTMDWTADGTTPWGDPPNPGPNGQSPVLIYTAVPNGYCYDALFSEALRAHLMSLHKNSIKVVYNEFTTFGTPSGYNIQSVEGMVVNKGRHSVIDTKGSYGGSMMIPTPGNPRTYRPLACPR